MALPLDEQHPSVGKDERGIDQFPPGTVRLMADRRASTAGHVHLQPKGTNDANDPFNWPRWRKILNFAFIIAVTITAHTGTTMQSLFWAQMRKDLHYTTKNLLTAKGMQMVGEVITCALFIPFAKKYGRRLIYIGSAVLFTVAIWWAANMQSVADLYLSNLLKGLATAIYDTAVQMTIRDLFQLHKRGTANGLYFLALNSGMSLTPIAAGAQATSYGWRSSYTTLGVVMTVLMVLFALGYEETKFVREGHLSDNLDTGNECSSSNVDSNEKDRQNAQVRSVEEEQQNKFPRNMRLQLVTKTGESLRKMYTLPFSVVPIPQVLVAAAIIGVDLSLMRTTGSMQSIMFSVAPYDFSPFQLSLLNLGQLVGGIFGSFYGGWLMDKGIVWLARRNGSIYEPEMRLHFLPLPAIVMAIGLIVYGATADAGMFWFIPVVGSTFSSFGFGAIMSIASTLLIDSFPNITSENFVVVSTIRNIIGLVGAFTVDPWRESMSVTAMFVVAACVTVGVHLFAIPIFIWGKKLRRKHAERYYKVASALHS